MKGEIKELTKEEVAIVTLKAVNLTFMSRYQTLNDAVYDLWLSKLNKTVLTDEYTKHLILELMSFCVWFVYSSNRSWGYKSDGGIPDTEWTDLEAGLKEYCDSLTATEKVRLEDDLRALVELAAK